MQFVTVIFVVALAVHLMLQVWLAWRQISHVLGHRATVPEGFATVVPAAEHARAADYEAAGQRLAVVEAIVGALATLAMPLGGGIAAIGRWAVELAGSGPAGGVVHVIGVLGCLALLDLPFAAYRTFSLEQRFGFNRTSVSTFVLDRLKGWTLAVILGGAVIAVLLRIMGAAGSSWWLVGWAAWLAFSLLTTWAWPRLIAPLFNKFTPLADADLRSRIDALLARCQFRARSVFVMDGSRRSSHGNAYFTGLGREKRIVFFDTLLGRLTHAQIESVLAHELAHFKLRHIPQRLVAGAALSLAGFAILGWLASRDWFYVALGVPEPSDSAALLLFALAAPAFTWLIGPPIAAWSRRHEYEADAFAARHSDGRELAEALVRLYRDNATTLTPDRLYAAFHDSHPDPVSRIARLRALGQASG
jgi:STE24 endopeptidase